MESIGRDQKNNAVAHVLVIPVSSLPSHMTPMLRLAAQLARRGITITFVSFGDPNSGLTPAGADGGSSSERQSLDFRFMPLRIAEVQVQGVRGANISRRFRQAFKPFMEKLVHDKSAGIGGGPTSIISDLFLPWTQNVADELQIPRYIFVTSGVIYARSAQGFLPYYESGQFQVSETDRKKLVAFDWSVCIPGLPSLRYHELPRVLLEHSVEFRQRCESLGQSAGVLVNSFFELEEKVIETWRSVGHPGYQHIKVPKIYPVGPLFSTSVPDVSVAPRGLEDSASTCLVWLGSQPPSSVLYVAFGSQFRLRPEQVHELALGLEDSKQRFLWVIPQLEGSSEVETPSSITKVLPPGFGRRVGRRGCIVTGWAPQLQILAHSATGGFFTHSGWNSTLESITSGVPMISWPRGAEQHLNCRYLVDDLKIAEQIQAGPENVLKRNEVERVVRLVMVESEGKAIKGRVEELQRKAAAAVADGGSQSRIFLEFLDDVHKHDLLQSQEEKNIELSNSGLQDTRQR